MECDGQLNQPRLMDAYGAFVGMGPVKGNRNTLRKPALVLLCDPQITHAPGIELRPLWWEATA
jgi:hypothetical protein